MTAHRRPRRIAARSFLMVAMMVIAQSSELQAQSPTRAHAPMGWVGCYTLSFVKSRSPVLFADSATFVRLDTVTTRDGSYVVRPGPGRSDRKWQVVLGETVTWEPVGADSLTIYAPYGYWHDVLTVARSGDSLSGLYKVHTDVIDSAQLHQRGTPVFGKRVPCRANSRRAQR